MGREDIARISFAATRASIGPAQVGEREKASTSLDESAGHTAELGTHPLMERVLSRCEIIRLTTRLNEASAMGFREIYEVMA